MIAVRWKKSVQLLAHHSKTPHRLRSPIYQTDEGYERIYSCEKMNELHIPNFCATDITGTVGCAHKTRSIQGLTYSKNLKEAIILKHFTTAGWKSLILMYHLMLRFLVVRNNN